MDKDQPAAAQVPRSDTGSAQSSSMMESHAPVLSAAQLDTLEALLAKATPEPWAAAEGNFIARDVPAGRIVAEVPCQGCNDDDLPAIVALRNAAPALLASARREARLRAVVESALKDPQFMISIPKALEALGEDIAMITCPRAGEVARLEHALAAKEAELRADRGQEYRLQQQHIDALNEEIESLRFANRDLQNGLTSKEAELREANAQLTDERKQHSLADGKRANRIAALDEQLAEANARTEEQKNGWGVAFKRAAQLQDEVKAERKAREEAERKLKQSTNYVANREVAPIFIVFRNGRTVRLAAGSLEVGWTRDQVDPEESFADKALWRFRIAVNESKVKEEILRRKAAERRAAQMFERMKERFFILHRTRKAQGRFISENDIDALQPESEQGGEKG